MSAHILVIEDEEAINDLICMNLEVTGYQVTAFFDGNEASKGLSEKDDYDCALGRNASGKGRFCPAS